MRVWSIGRVQRGFLIAALCVIPAAKAADLGVSGKKFIAINKIATSGKTKLVYLSRGDPGIAKGAAGDPASLSGEFDWFYTDDPGAVNGHFDLDSAFWVTNNDRLAKYVTSDVAQPVRAVVIKPGVVAKVVGRLLATTGNPNLFSGPPSESGGLTTVLSIDNQNDLSSHRMCTVFAVASGGTLVLKEIAGGTGRKLIAKNGVPTPCPPVGSPSGAFLDAADGR